MTVAKVRCAVVLVTCGDLVLALTRGTGRSTDALTWLADLHLPGGKEEPEDGGDPRVTATRELAEETGLHVCAGDLRHVIDTRAPSGLPVSAFAIQAPAFAPEHFARTDAGQPGWVPAGALVQPWCSLRSVASEVLSAAGLGVQPGTAHAECPDCGAWHMAAEEHGGLRLPVHRSHPEDPRSLLLCAGSLAILDAEGTPRLDAVTIAGLAELVVEARATASLAGALCTIGTRGRP